MFGQDSCEYRPRSLQNRLRRPYRALPVQGAVQHHLRRPGGVDGQRPGRPAVRASGARPRLSTMKVESSPALSHPLLLAGFDRRFLRPRRLGKFCRNPFRLPQDAQQIESRHLLDVVPKVEGTGSRRGTGIQGATRHFGSSLRRAASRRKSGCLGRRGQHPDADGRGQACTVYSWGLYAHCGGGTLT